MEYEIEKDAQLVHVTVRGTFIVGPLLVVEGSVTISGSSVDEAFLNQLNMLHNIQPVDRQAILDDVRKVEASGVKQDKKTAVIVPNSKAIERIK